MLHHPTGVARGQASDVHNEGRELLRTRDYMDATLSVACGRSFDAIQNVRRLLLLLPAAPVDTATVCCACPCPLLLLCVCVALLLGGVAVSAALRCSCSSRCVPAAGCPARCARAAAPAAKACAVNSRDVA